MKTVTTEEIEYDSDGNVVKRTTTTVTEEEKPRLPKLGPGVDIRPWREPWQYPNPGVYWTTNHPDGCYAYTQLHG